MAARAARARAYRLLGALIDGSPAAADDDDAIEVARSIDPLDALFAGRSTPEVCAAHYRCFGIEAFPRAGFYRDGLVRDGDELGTALAELGGLDAAGDDRGCARVLAGLLGWMPPFTVAVRALVDGRATVARDVDADPWPAVIELAVELIGDHAVELEVAAAPPRPGRFAVEADTGIRELAAALCRPADSGVMITLDAARRIGRRLEVPAGFGGRRQVVQRLFESAASLGCPAAALAGFADLAGQAAAALADLGGQPGWSAAVIGWLERAAATRDRLVDMHDQLISSPNRAADG